MTRREVLAWLAARRPVPPDALRAGIEAVVSEAELSPLDPLPDQLALLGRQMLGREAASGLPLALFPGSALQLTAEVDLVLFLSLVSGRNAQYLIEEHVRAVPFLTRHPVATLSTGYILVDGGRVTSVEAVSQTRPLPADKPELAAAHATAARLIGMRAIYLDAASGSPRPVAADVLRACRAAVPDLTLFVGGGIKSAAQVRAARAAGADFVVVGTALEERGASAADLPALVRAAAG